MKTSYNQIVNIQDIATTIPVRNYAEIAELARMEGGLPASCDTIKVLLVCIDPENDFMEDIGTLGVKGSKGDIERTTKWIYKNANKITRTMVSLDTHKMAQIFHPCWWRDEAGNAPAPFTTITCDDFNNKKWIPNYDKTIPSPFKIGERISYCGEYLRNLEAKGKYHCIWPYHCIDGTFGGNIEGQLSKMLYFHSCYRQIDPVIVRKGTDPWSEMYGIIKPEWSDTPYINEDVIREMTMYDIVVFVGEASSHCVGESGKQVLYQFNYGPKFAHVHKPKFVFLKDCMSPVAGCEEAAELIFKELETEYGALVVNSTDFVL